MTSHRRTRNETFTKMSKYLGKGKEISQKELPTLRDCLLFGILLKETHENYKNKSSKELCKEVLVQIRQRWTKANFKFQPPVTALDMTIRDRLVKFWEKASKIAWKHVNPASKKEAAKFEIQLDKLFDITKCKCPMYTCEASEVHCTGCHCEEPDCAGCPKEVVALPPCHIVCKCPPQQKIPVLELPFVKALREKVEEKSAAMIVNVDYKESTKQFKEARKREQYRKIKDAKEKKKAEK